jgi:hypothetical protein
MLASGDCVQNAEMNKSEEEMIAYYSKVVIQASGGRLRSADKTSWDKNKNIGNSFETKGNVTFSFYDVYYSKINIFLDLWLFICHF